MENPLKIKIIICAISISLLFTIAMIKTNFYTTPVYKKWSELNWKDFGGLAKPFTGFGAAISSDIYLEYDTINSKYFSYAAQNNQESWKKNENETSKYLLNHEQYHFNITELFSRKMNTFIKENPNENKTFYNKKLFQLKKEISIMQSLYDDQSQHGISEVNQRLWEYKIDKSLREYEDYNGFIVDKYSGAKACFLEDPKFKTGLDTVNNYTYRQYRVDKYDMNFQLVSFQYLVLEFEDFEESIKIFYQTKNLKILSSDTKKGNNTTEIRMTVLDSLNDDIIENLWVQSPKYVHKMTVRYPYDYRTNSKYTEIANNFINSFKITETDNYWKEKFKTFNLNYKYRNLTKSTSEDWDCLVYAAINQHVFYRGPIFFEDGSFFIVQNIVGRNLKKVKYNILKLNDHIFQYEKRVTDHFLYVPIEKIPKNSFHIEFGYVPEDNMKKDCYYFNFMWLDI